MRIANIANRAAFITKAVTTTNAHWIFAAGIIGPPIEYLPPLTRRWLQASPTINSAAGGHAKEAIKAAEFTAFRTFWVALDDEEVLSRDETITEFQMWTK
jgi:hypothetical protein